MVRYTVIPVQPDAHLFSVACSVVLTDGAARLGQVFSLPAWIPGSYMIREFSRNVVEIRAEVRAKSRAPVQQIELTKLDKHSWRSAPCQGTLTIIATIYAWDLSVRGAHLDSTHGFFNGASLFLRVIGHEEEPHVLDLRRPPGRIGSDWRVATTLNELNAPRYGFGTYRASNYDELIDHPVEMGEFKLGKFKAHGVPHEIAITGKVPRLDIERICADLQCVCETQIALFEPKTFRAPFNRYMFLVMAVGDGYGGLEHRASTALICKRDDLPSTVPAMTYAPSEGYQSFLGLASHEYFHSWNVKRIKPAVFAPYTLENEAYTRLLWIFEGFTSYYDDLLLLRSGLIEVPQYLNQLEKTIQNVLQGSGRKKQSVAESSFDAWIKYYRQDENAPNAIVSYYTKGALVALAIDLHIRHVSGGRRSLDDVMRLLWVRFGRDFYPTNARGLNEDEFPAIVREATGITMKRQIDDWAYGTSDLPLVRLLKRAGVDMSRVAGAIRPTLGAKIASGNECRLAQVHDGGAAQQSGLSAGDLLVALDGLRITASNLDALLTRYAIGDTVQIHAFRRDELMVFEVALTESGHGSYKLTCLEKSPGLRLRRAWLGA